MGKWNRYTYDIFSRWTDINILITYQTHLIQRFVRKFKIWNTSLRRINRDKLSVKNSHFNKMVPYFCRAMYVWSFSRVKERWCARRNMKCWWIRSRVLYLPRMFSESFESASRMVPRLRSRDETGKRSDCTRLNLVERGEAAKRVSLPKIECYQATTSFPLNYNLAWYCCIRAWKDK